MTKPNIQCILQFYTPVFQHLDTHCFSIEYRGPFYRRTHFFGIELSEVPGSCDAENRSVEVTILVCRVFITAIVLQVVHFATD